METSLLNIKMSDIKKGFFLKWNKNFNLGPAALQIFLVIIACENEKSMTKISYEKIKKLTGFSITTIHKNIYKLKKEGIILVEKKGQHSNVYKF